MSNHDIAFELTKAAIEKGIIDIYPGFQNPSREDNNMYTAKQITDFFNYITEHISD